MRKMLQKKYFIGEAFNYEIFLTLFLDSWVPQRFSSNGD